MSSIWVGMFDVTGPKDNGILGGFAGLGYGLQPKRKMQQSSKRECNMRCVTLVCKW